MSPAEKFLARLDSVVERPNKNFFACCPAHDDNRPSLSIKEVENGRLLLYCFAGCRPEDICGAVGLEMRDLFPQDAEQDYYRASHRWNYRDLLAILAVEATVVQLAAGVLCEGSSLSMQDSIRLEKACGRIRKITGVANAVL